MKAGYFLSGLIPMFAFSALNVNENGGTGFSGTAKVNPDKSEVVWRAYKVTGKHHGTVEIQSGDLKFDDGVLTGGSFVMDMSSIACSDLEGGSNEKLVNHLKSDDFFGVSSHPTSKFVITKVIPYGTSGEYKIVGDLTIKGTTKPVKFNATVKEDGSQIKGDAKITIDRAEYNVRYGSGSFFDNLGDKTIYDEFDLEISLVATK